MTSQGRAYSRFKRALETGDLASIRAAASELPRIGLRDALGICRAMRDRPELCERAAARWIGRFVLAAPRADLAALERALEAFADLRHVPVDGIAALAKLCRDYDVSVV